MSASRSTRGALRIWAVSTRGHDASVGESSPRDLWIAPPPDSPLASVGLRVAGDGALLRVWLNPRRPQGVAPVPRVRPNEREAVSELRAYLAGTLRRFAVPWRLSEEATPFRREVLRAAARIPYGETVGYGELAARAGHPGAARAVGSAMATNPLPLLIPCHRVVAAQGRLGGFTGGLATKRALLEHEGRRFPGVPGTYR